MKLLLHPETPTVLHFVSQAVYFKDFLKIIKFPATKYNWHLLKVPHAFKYIMTNSSYHGIAHTLLSILNIKGLGDHNSFKCSIVPSAFILISIIKMLIANIN